jgi:hypothetical protein
MVAELTPSAGSRAMLWEGTGIARSIYFDTIRFRMVSERGDIILTPISTLNPRVLISYNLAFNP